MAKLKPYRCTNPTHGDPLKGLDFWTESPNPTCPECLVATKGPYGDIIVPLVVIHFDTPSPIPGRGTRKRPCDGKDIAAGGDQGTGNPHAVTCLDCKETDIYTKRLAEWDDVSDDEARASISRMVINRGN